MSLVVSIPFGSQRETGNWILNELMGNVWKEKRGPIFFVVVRISIGLVVCGECRRCCRVLASDVQSLFSFSSVSRLNTNVERLIYMKQLTLVWRGVIPWERGKSLEKVNNENPESRTVCHSISRWITMRKWYYTHEYKHIPSKVWKHLGIILGNSWA